MAKNKSNILLSLCILIIGVIVIPLLGSCSKTGVNVGANTNARLQMVNLSPDVQPFKLYSLFLPQNSNSYSYPIASGYFLVNPLDTPFQIRTANPVSGTIASNLLTLQQKMQPRVPYTWFVTGLKADSSLRTILTVDTSSVPPTGRAKLRFVNAAPGTLSLNVTANGTLAFKDVKYTNVTDYIELTSGSYNINVAASNAPTTVLSGQRNYTVLDGKLYTMYFYGLSNRADSAAYGTGVILNSLPPGTTY